jgi:glycosyltransferase involved in cell wall biosynthesis
VKKIVLISVGQPSTNPRLVKEANALEKAGFDVYVIYSFWIQWAWEADKLLFSKVRWKPLLVGGTPSEHKISYFFSRLRVKIFELIAKNVTLKLGIAEIARGRAYPELFEKAKSIKADLYIAHIQAALPAAVNAAKKHNAKCSFDAEDFHRQEVSDDANSYHFKISKYLEDKYLPQVDYITTASPFISKEYKKLYPDVKNIVINNVFESDQQLEIGANNTKGLSLFWFSQTIGLNRGLEDVIKALQLLKDYSFDLHLLGDADEDIKKNFTEQLSEKPKTIFFHKPVPSDKIIAFAAQFDIGLALENNTPFNRDICLTNKLFTYIQSGLAVVASDTMAQTDFLNKYPAIGKLYEKRNAQSLADTLLYYHQNRDKLFETRKAALSVAHEQLNWGNESKKFLQMVRETISKIE